MTLSRAWGVLAEVAGGLVILQIMHQLQGLVTCWGVMAGVAGALIIGGVVVGVFGIGIHCYSS